MISFVNGKELDEEWVELINEALELGISADEIRDFFRNKNGDSSVPAFQSKDD